MSRQKWAEVCPMLLDNLRHGHPQRDQLPTCPRSLNRRSTPMHAAPEYLTPRVRSPTPTRNSPLATLTLIVIPSDLFHIGHELDALVMTDPPEHRILGVAIAAVRTLEAVNNTLTVAAKKVKFSCPTLYCFVSTLPVFTLELRLRTPSELSILPTFTELFHQTHMCLWKKSNTILYPRSYSFLTFSCSRSLRAAIQPWIWSGNHSTT